MKIEKPFIKMKLSKCIFENYNEKEKKKDPIILFDFVVGGENLIIFLSYHANLIFKIDFFKF